MAKIKMKTKTKNKKSTLKLKNIPELKKTIFIKFNTIKKYILTVKKMRSSEEAINELIKKFDSTIADVITESGKLAKEDKRNTIMDQDVIPALEKYIGKFRFIFFYLF